MEGYGQLDASCRATNLIAILGCIFLLASIGFTQDTASSADAARIHQLFQSENWQAIANLHPKLGLSPDTDFEYGIALARLEHWDEAAAALKSGLKLRPLDPRFMVELAGVAFKQNKYPEAEDWLRRAIRLSGNDVYNYDFLGTIFYLEGNIGAALKYWNRIGKPHIQSVISDPKPKLDTVLLDRAFTFAPASTLQLADLQKSDELIRHLDVFSTFRFQLDAQPDGDFNLAFRGTERNGCAGNSWACLLLVFGETPAQTVNFDYANIAQKAINFSSFFRWDAEKRRLQAQVELPVLNNPKWEIHAGTDLRNENWALRSSFTGPAPLLGALNLKREAVNFRFSDVMSGSWSWSAATEVSTRSYHDVFSGNFLSAALLTPGTELKQSFSVAGTPLRWPEQRLTVEASATGTGAKLWSATRGFEQLQGTATLHWFPQHTGEKYEIQHQIRVGRTFGDPPFDELFVLGVLGDTDLYMRAHIATRGGKKGSAPMGRNYFVSNWEALREVSPISIAHIKIGPFVDTGNIGDPLPQFGSHKWVWDAGLEARLQAFGLSVTFSYGRDLRGGKNAFVVTSP